MASSNFSSHLMFFYQPIKIDHDMIFFLIYRQIVFPYFHLPLPLIKKTTFNHIIFSFICLFPFFFLLFQCLINISYSYVTFYCDFVCVKNIVISYLKLVFICSLCFTGFLFWTWKPIKRKEEMHHISIRIYMKYLFLCSICFWK